MGRKEKAVGYLGFAKRWWWAVVLIVLGALIAIRAFDGKGPDSGLAPVQRGPIVDSVYGIGTLTAQRSLAIKSGVLSAIHRIYVNEGDRVRKGQRLVDLEGAASFTAPFDAVISTSGLKEGEAVFSQTIIMTLIDLSDVYLTVSIEQQGALKVHAGLPVKVSFDGMRERSFDGRVESVYSNTTDFLARISLRELPPNILPGMTADVAIILREKKDAVLVPVAALDNNSLIIKRQSGGFETRKVKIGLVDGATAEIVDGDLQVGDQVQLPKPAGKGT